MLRSFSIFLMFAASTMPSLAACSTSEEIKNKENNLVTEKTGFVSQDDLRLKLAEPFIADASWLSTTPQSDNPEVILVSLPDNVSETRIVRLNRDKGYKIFRGAISCPNGSFAVRDARETAFDTSVPMKDADPVLNFDISKTLTEICSKKARLPLFKGNLISAVANARKMDNQISIAEARVGKIDKDENASNYKFPKTVVINKQ